jgi:O-antigen ligase
VLIRDRSLLQRMIIFLIIGVTTMEAMGVGAYYYFTDYTQANAIFGPDFIDGSGRLGAMIGEPNWNAAEVAMALPFVMYAACKRMISSLAALVAVGILCWGLLLSASFTGFCAAMLAMGIMAVAGRMRPSPKVLMLAGLLVAGLYASGYQMPDIFAKRVGTALQTGNLDEAGTFDDRALLIAEAWSKAEHNAIIGMGVDQFRKSSVFGQPVHNMYMLQFSEGGILALAGWVALAGMLALIPLWRLGRNRLEASLSLSTIMVFQVFTMASPHMFARFWMVPVLIPLGLLLAPDGLPIGGRSFTPKRKAAVPAMH